MPQVRIKQNFSGGSAAKSENVNFVILSAAYPYGLLNSLQQLLPSPQPVWGAVGNLYLD